MLTALGLGSQVLGFPSVAQEPRGGRVKATDMANSHGITGQKGSWSQQGHTVSARERTRSKSPASVRPLSLSGKGTTYKFKASPPRGAVCGLPYSKPHPGCTLSAAPRWRNQVISHCSDSLGTGLAPAAPAQRGQGGSPLSC